MADVPAPSFDTTAARADGVSDAAIAAFLAPKVGFDLTAARKDGVSDGAIVDFLAPPSPTPKPEAAPEPVSGMMKGIGKAAGQAAIEKVGGLKTGIGGIVKSAGQSEARESGLDIGLMQRLDQGEDFGALMKSAPNDLARLALTQYRRASPEEKATIRQDAMNAVAQPPGAVEQAGTNIMEAGHDLSAKAKELIPLTPEEEQRPEVMGVKMLVGLVPYIGAGLVAGLPGVMAYGGVQSFGQTYDEAKAKGARDDVAAGAALLNGVVQGGAMAVPIGESLKLFQMVPVALRGKVMTTIAEAAKSGLVLTGFSQASKIADNVVAQNTYDPTRPTLQGVGEPKEMAVTAGVGALLPAAGAVVRKALPKTPEEVAKPVLDAPDVDTAIEQAKAAVAQPVDVDTLARQAQEFGGAQDQQQAKLLQLFGGLNAGTVEQAGDGAFHYRMGDGETTIPLKVWNENTPAVEGAEPTIPATLAAAQRDHYEKMGMKVVYFENDPAIPFDGAVDPQNPNTLFLSNNPQRNAEQVGAHEVMHVLESTTLPDGTNLGDLLHRQITEGITNEGWRHAAETFGKTAPDRAAFPAGLEGDSAHADAVVSHLVRELGADIGGEAPRFQTFLPRVVDEVQARYGADAAKGVLQKLIAGIQQAMRTLRGFFARPEEHAEFGQPDTVSQNWVSNLDAVHDTLAKMYAVKFGTEAERQGIIAEVAQKNAAREVPPEGQAAAPRGIVPEVAIPSGEPAQARAAEAPQTPVPPGPLIHDEKVRAEKERVWADKGIMGGVYRGIGRNEQFATDVARERVMREEVGPAVQRAVEEEGIPADAVPAIAKMYRRGEGETPAAAFEKAVDRWVTQEEAKGAHQFSDEDAAHYDMLKNEGKSDPVLEEMFAALENHHTGGRREIPGDEDVPFGNAKTHTAEGAGAEAAAGEGARPEGRETGEQPRGRSEVADEEKSGVDETQFSPRITGENKGRAYTPEERAAYERLGRAEESVPLMERWQEFKKNLGTKIIRATLDPYVGVKDSDPLGYMALRNFNTTGGALESLLTNGTLKFDGLAFNLKDHNGGVENMVVKPLRGEHDDWAWWVAAHRAERLAAEDREHLFTPEEIAVLKKTNQGELSFDYQLPNGKVTRSREAAYADTLRKYDLFNKNVMDLGIEAGLFSREKVDALWSNPFYVPFYRQADTSSHFVGASNSNNFVKQTAFKALKGGTEKLHNDLWENIIGNWGHIIDAAGKNLAANRVLDTASSDANGAARKITAQEYDHQMSKTDKEDSTWTMVDGKKQYWHITDPMLFDAIGALNTLGFRDPVSKAANWFSRVLRMGVTSDPRFMLRITIKDTEQAVATAPMSYNVAKNIVQGYSMTDLPGALKNVARAAAGAELHELNEAAELRQALAGGGLMRLGAGHASGMRTTTAESMSGATPTVSDGVAYLARVFRAYKTAMAQSEDINRAALYKTMRDQGAPHDEAAFAARDLEDFTLKGTATVVRWLAQNVTFMNAGAQGLYKVGRSAADSDRNVTAAVGGKLAWAATSRVAKVLAATTLATLALDYIYKDDEDYKKRSEYDRNSKFWFKFGDYQIQIPMGFEVAALSRIAANGLDAFFDKEMTGDRFRQNALSIVGANMFMDPIPTAASGILDLATNTSGSGHPIEPKGIENLRPEERFTVNNTLAARGLSSAGNAISRAVGGPNAEFLSPIQLDYLWGAYTGWLGSFVLGAADRTARSFTSEPVRPAVDMWNFATGGMVSKGETPQSRYVDMMYRQADAVDKAYGTYRDLIQRQQYAEAQKFFEDNRDMIAKHGMVDSVVRLESQLNKQIRFLTNNPDPAVTPEMKRVQIMRLQAIKNRAAEQVFGAH